MALTTMTLNIAASPPLLTSLGLLGQVCFFFLHFVFHFTNRFFRYLFTTTMGWHDLEMMTTGGHDYKRAQMTKQGFVICAPGVFTLFVVFYFTYEPFSNT